MNFFFKLLAFTLFISFLSCKKGTKDFENLVEVRYSGQNFVNEEIWIEEEEILILEPGSIIEFGPLGSFQVKGEIEAIGTAENPISLIGSDELASHTIINTFDDNAINFTLHYSTIHNGLIITEAENNDFFEVHITNDKQLETNDASIRSWRGSFSFVDGSIQSNNTGEGLLVHGSQNPLVSNCFFYKIPDAVEFLSSNDGMINHSIFEEMSDDAIDNNNCNRTMITNNEFYAVKNRALEIGSDGFGISTDIQIINNLFVECSIGVNVKESSSAKVEMATFYNNEINIELLEGDNETTITSLEIKQSVMSGEQAHITKENNTEFTYNHLMSDQLIDNWSQLFIAEIQFSNVDSLDFRIISQDFPDAQNAMTMGYQY